MPAKKATTETPQTPEKETATTTPATPSTPSTPETPSAPSTPEKDETKTVEPVAEEKLPRKVKVEHKQTGTEFMVSSDYYRRNKAVLKLIG